MTRPAVLVTGGRDFADAELVARALAELAPRLLIHGASRGADALADAWAEAARIPREPYPVTEAEWDRYGLAAGPIRNGRMVRRLLELAEPRIVVAFPGGKGTADCCGQARRKGLRVIELVCSESLQLIDVPRSGSD